MFESMVKHIDSLGFDYGVCGDLILQGDNPVECMSLAISTAKRLVFGFDTYQMFNAMHGNSDSLRYLKHRGWDKMYKSIEPYEGMVVSLYGRSEMMYRTDEYIVTGNSIPKGFKPSENFNGVIGHLFNNLTHDDMIARKAHAGVDLIVRASISRVRSNRLDFVEDGVAYLNTGKQLLSAISEPMDGRSMLLSCNDDGVIDVCEVTL